MRKAVAALGVASLFLAGTRAPSEPAGVPADFKLVIALHGVKKEPVHAAELVVRNGRAYHFASGPPLEVIVNAAAAERLELVDLDRKLRSDVSAKKLDAFLVKLRDAIAGANARRERGGGRANEVAVAMSRDLIDPRFQETYDPAAHRLRLTNPTVEVVASGEPEPDAARLALIANTLSALAKLESLRDPRAIPPFSMLETLRALAETHKLRPTELTFLYRLAGPPKKLRWTYRLVPELTGREVEALSRVDAMMARCPYAKFEQYERPGE